MSKVIVIGGGAAGMIAAYASSKKGNQVILLEKMNELGCKIKITGKGRCNITSNIDIKEFIKNINKNGKFLYSAFENFDNKDIIELLNISTKVERGNRIFPVSDRAQDVVEALKRKLKNVEIIKNITVKEIIVENQKVSGVKTDKKIFEADKVILATGGMSYPGTGSTGDGYNMAKKLGHNIIDLKPSLIPLVTENEYLDICRKLQGLTLKNVLIKVFENEKQIYDDFGEMLFAHFGLTGPIILSASAHLIRTKMRNPYIIIDFKKGLTKEKLNNRILRDFEKYKNKELKNSLNDLLPQKLIPVIIELSGIDENKKVNSITKEERYKIIEIIKNFKIKIAGYRGIKEAIVTAGGIDVKEINPKTMESKKIENLYFAGEIIDVDGYTGGFNLQIAYSTGYTAGINT